MAARGARSRKVVEKQINKETAKHGDRFGSVMSPTPESSRSGSRHNATKSPVAGWGRKGTSTMSSAASTTSRDSGGSRVSSVGNMIDAKLAAAVSGEAFIGSKGKQTIAPRGRRGGVPVKVSEARNGRDSVRSVKGRKSVMSPPGFRAHSISTMYSELSSQEATRSWENTKVWYGGGVPPKPYQGFEHDDDMWMSDGNCLIFFSEETEEEDPKPMLRVHTSTLEMARSTFMINLLRYGEIVADDDDSTPPSSSSGPSNPGTFNGWPLTETSLGNLDELLNHGHVIHPPKTPDVPSRRSTGSHTWSTSAQTYIPDNPGHGGPLPVLSRTQGSLRVPPGIAPSVTSATEIPEEPESPTGGLDPIPAEITHEIWFRAPSHIKRPDIQRRHHIATRNYLALLYGLPIIGNDFYEMLSDLQNVMDTYYELNEASERWNSVQVIIQYIVQRKLDDVRGNLTTALGLMTWAEQRNVNWDAGYLEGFVHSIGMMTPKTLQMREYKQLFQVSRHKMQNAYNALQLRLIEAEERLGTFDFPELWYAEGTTTNHPAQGAYNGFRVFLFEFYRREYGHWPPREQDHQGHWIGKSIVNRMQVDMGALYDYLVDRDVLWDVSEERHTRKWEMVCTASHRSASFMPDLPGLPLTNMLVGFDSSMQYEHIPHPFPLLPHLNAGPKEKTSKRGFFSKLKGSKEKEPVSLPGAKEQFQLALAFNAATNVDRLGTTFKDNKLLDAFQTHEKSFSPSVVSPTDARLGRWILLYAVLEVLSTLSVDVSGLRFTDKIRYFASPSLEGCPPWSSPTSSGADITPINLVPGPGGAGIVREARQTGSYCWLAPERWHNAERGGATPTPASLQNYGPNPRAAVAASRSPALRPNVAGGSQASLYRVSELEGRAVGTAPSRVGVKNASLMPGNGNGNGNGNGGSNGSSQTSLSVTPLVSPMMSPMLMPVHHQHQHGYGGQQHHASNPMDMKPDVPRRNPSRSGERNERTDRRERRPRPASPEGKVLEAGMYGMGHRHGMV